jgi:DNA-directed RNA polymerase subunit E'/Rpb7
MSEIKKLTKRLVVANDCLDKNLNDAIFKRLQVASENDCNKEYGYILKVEKLLKIDDNYISNVNSELIFIVSFKALTIKPEINKVFTDTIWMVLSGGIFLNVKNKFKVLIPPNALSEYSFNQDKKAYIHKENKTILEQGSECTVKITGIRYMNKNFDCFAELV